MNQHEARISELEHLDSPPRKRPRHFRYSLPSLSLPINPENESHPSVRSGSALAQDPRGFNNSLDQLELGAPIATLRSLGALGDRRGLANESATMKTRSASLDPIENCTLTEEEASCAFDM